VTFAELIFTSLIQISALNPKFVTLAMLGIALVRQAKVFISRKVVLPARVTLPAKVKQLAHWSCLGPLVNGWLNFAKK